MEAIKHVNSEGRRWQYNAWISGSWASRLVSGARSKSHVAPVTSEDGRPQLGLKQSRCVTPVGEAMGMREHTGSQSSSNQCLAS